MRPRLPAAGFAPAVGFRSDDDVAVQALVAAGLGVSVIPGLAVTYPLPGLEVRTVRCAPVRQISAARDARRLPRPRGRRDAGGACAR